MNTNLLQQRHYLFLYFLLAIAYCIGLFVPLMDSDAAHHANIALHMYLTHDFVSLIDRGSDYLDKPHLLFWLAGAMYYIFGVTAFAYKLPSFLFSIAAVYATKKLGERLYGSQTGKLAALLLASAQAFIVSCNDVRMDALLTANIILASWQLVEIVENRKWYNYVLAALFMALGFATKGLVGIVMPGVAIFFYLVYKRDFKIIFSLRWLLVAVLLVFCMLPVVYCYYLQFDLHPEKVIRGRSGISGVQFILWGQNTERLDGKNWGGGKKDYTFYLHTMLWAYLPWCILAYYAIGSKLKHLFTTRGAYQKDTEGLTIGTIMVIFVLISLSQFQLPHYLNILFPFFSIITAARLMHLSSQHNQKALRVLLIIQKVIVFILCLVVLVLCGWFFPVTDIYLIAGGFVLLVITFIAMFRKDDLLRKMIVMSVACMAFGNVLLNGNFYPKIMEYQGGSSLADIVKEKHIPVNELAFYNDHSFSFDFETANLAPQLSLGEIQNARRSLWIFTNDEGLDSLRNAGGNISTMYSADQYRVTRLTMRFLNPQTRTGVLRKFYLANIIPAPR